MKFIDLHTHSTASDGSFSPAQLVEKAEQAGLGALALTDHDSVDGLKEANKRAAELGLEFINGIELSVGTKMGSVHMLGYLMDYEDAEFMKGLVLMNKRRDERNFKFLEKFKSIGIELDLNELLEIAGEGSVGRPHFAKLLIRNGVVKTFDEAFDKYLAKGKAAYVEKERVSPEEGIELIHRAQGLAVLAHPKYSGARTESEVDALVKRLKLAGLNGIECYYTDHTEQETAFYLSMAKKYDLFVTGGSDFHGEAAPNNVLGKIPGYERIAYELLENMKRTYGSLYQSE